MRWRCGWQVGMEQSKPGQVWTAKGRSNQWKSRTAIEASVLSAQSSMDQASTLPTVLQHERTLVMFQHPYPNQSV